MQQFQEPYTRLRFIRSLTGLSRFAIEEKYQLPEITLKKWETGKMAISDKGIDKCIEIYKQENISVTYEWIKNGIGPLPTFTSLIKNQDRDIQYFKSTYSNLLIYQLINDEMAPKYNIGETVLGIIDNKEPEYFNNLDCIVQLENGEIIFRKVAIHNENKINLICTNNSSKNNFIMLDVKPLAIAPAIWHKIPLPRNCT
jgi:transcriptional regulator with XRE-family HTH domain